MTIQIPNFHISNKSKTVGSANNKTSSEGTADVVGFVVYDRKGNMVA